MTDAAASRWRASPQRLVRLLAGLWLFGTGEGLVVHGELGASPWTVFAQGVSVQTPLSIGQATILISGGVLLLWILLHQRPGLGTILNAVLIGVAIDVTLELVGDDPGLLERWASLLGGVALVAIGSGFYLGAALGPGPRDGLMTGIHRATGRPVSHVRLVIEVLALLIGALLGGTVGVGTVVFALSIGPAVHLALHVMSPITATEM